MEKKLKPSEKLDLVLNYLESKRDLGYKHTSEIYANLNNSEFPFRGIPTIINIRDVNKVIKKLKRDVFIEEKMLEISGSFDTRLYPHYMTTFEGDAMLELEGGYRGRILAQNFLTENEKKRDIEAEKQKILQMRLQTKLTRLTGWIAFGTIVAAIYYLNELCKQYHWFDFCWCK